MTRARAFSVSGRLLCGSLTLAVPTSLADERRGRGRGGDIPAGHLPPPGACRIWFPDRPPGHQPPPGPCEALRSRVPRGAQLIYGGGERRRSRDDEREARRWRASRAYREASDADERFSPSPYEESRRRRW
jgi:hypothetical protein